MSVGTQDAGLATTYRDAMREAIRQALIADPRVFLNGRGCGRLWRLLRGEQGIAGRVRAGAESATRRSPNPPLSAPASAPRLAGCTRSSRS